MKDDTADLHALAEQYVRILDADARISDYARYLRAMLGYHLPIEETFAANDDLAQLGFAAQRRRKSHLLERDLETLGEERPFARCTAMPALPSMGHCIGAAYVIEGSTLGGRYILSRLPAVLAAVRGSATAFLEGYGAETGARWRAFGAIVERALADRDAEDAAVAGARATFSTLIDWLAMFEGRDERRVAS
ncbi:MAG: biliverdin-producing heme oxygenase [Kofleriaceae bacterium]|nr:biliverdin-producing heme oxygenase [Kofleriaceae bacterium]